MTRRKTKPHTAKPHRSRHKQSKAMGIASTLKAAASISGLSEAVIRRAKDLGCRAFKANGRVDCDALLEFVATLPESEDASLDYSLERAKKMRAERMLKEQQYRQREKLVWPIEKIRQAWTRNVVACKSKMMTAENAVAVEAGMRLNLTGDQISAIKEILMKHSRAALKELFAGEWGKTQCPNCKTEITS